MENRHSDCCAGNDIKRNAGKCAMKYVDFESLATKRLLLRKLPPNMKNAEKFMMQKDI